MRKGFFVLTIVAATVLAGCAGTAGAPTTGGTTTAPEATVPATGGGTTEAPMATAPVTGGGTTAAATAAAASATEAPMATAEATSMAGGTAMAPSGTAEATAPSTGGAGGAGGTTVTNWQRVQIPDLNVSFDVPSGWHQVGNEWSWSPSTSGQPLIGFNWANTDANFLPTSFLPANVQIVRTDSVDLGWAKATRYTVNVIDPNNESAPPSSVQVHTIAQTPDNRAYDLFISGHNADEVASLQPVVEHMLTSVRIGG